MEKGEIYPYRTSLLSFFGPVYYLSFFDLRIAITVSIDCPFFIATFSNVYINYYMIKDVHIYVKNCFLSTHMLLKSPVVAVI
jgi:hypothetical protein